MNVIAYSDAICQINHVAFSKIVTHSVCIISLFLHCAHPVWAPGLSEQGLLCYPAGGRERCTKPRHSTVLARVGLCVMFQVYAVFCFFVFGCQYLCNRLPVRLVSLMTCYVLSGTLNLIHSLLPSV